MITSLFIFIQTVLGGIFWHTPEYPHIKLNADPIDVEVFRNMYTYAHLIDISYCISPTSRLEEPFSCDLNCEQRFPNTTLVYQWYFDDSVSGYIATSYRNIFNSELQPKKTIIVSLRGTRSLPDSYTDIKVDMVNYNNIGYKLRKCGLNCRVHRGFHDNYLHTLEKIDEILKEELDSEEDYELLIVGHSLGGAVAMFLGLHYLDHGYEKITVVTMGQPLTGNKQFTEFVDDVMGSRFPIEHDTYDRKFFRVIHKGDVVTTIPNSGNLIEPYVQFDNQIYLNCSSGDSRPTLENVVDCYTGNNPRCILGDFDSIFDFSNNYLQTHTTYFRSMGLCGIGFK